MKKKNSIHTRLAALAFAASMSLALASCGSGDSSVKESGTVNIPASSKAEVTSSASEAPAESSAAEVSSAVESAADSAAESTASEANAPEVPATASFAEKTKFKYNGATIEYGTKFADIKDQLGKMSKPSSTSTPCVPNAHDVEYYYYAGLIIQVNFEGTIIDIQLNEEMAPGREGSTAGGLKLGDTREKAKEFLGEPTSEDEYCISYKDPDSTKTLNVYDREGEGIYIIGISDMNATL